MSAPGLLLLRNTPQELLDTENTVTVLAFLGQARYLDGCSQDDDERFEHGRQLVLEWLEASLDFDPRNPPPEIQPGQLLYECAEVLYFLYSLEPLRNTCPDEERAGRVVCGYMRVLSWTERRILRASGIGEARTHKTPGEKADERAQIRSAMEERSASPIN